MQHFFLEVRPHHWRWLELLGDRRSDQNRHGRTTLNDAVSQATIGSPSVAACFCNLVLSGAFRMVVEIVRMLRLQVSLSVPHRPLESEWQKKSKGDCRSRTGCFPTYRNQAPPETSKWLCAMPFMIAFSHSTGQIVHADQVEVSRDAPLPESKILCIMSQPHTVKRLKRHETYPYQYAVCT